MADISRDLKVVGNDSINNLFDFVMSWNAISKENGDEIDKFMAERTLLEVGEAIYLYARSKEMQCQK